MDIGDSAVAETPSFRLENITWAVYKIKTTSETGKKAIRMRADNKTAVSEQLYECFFSNAIKGINGNNDPAA
jgi:hypothetical protein